jgi:hypothetical protein
MFMEIQRIINNCKLERIKEKVFITCFKALSQHSHWNEKSTKIPSLDLNFVPPESKSRIS